MQVDSGVGSKEQRESLSTGRRRVTCIRAGWKQRPGSGASVAPIRLRQAGRARLEAQLHTRGLISGRGCVGSRAGRAQLHPPSSGSPSASQFLLDMDRTWAGVGVGRTSRKPRASGMLSGLRVGGWS